DGTPLPNCPPLPGTDGDITSQHAAPITEQTIIPAGLADTFSLDHTTWAYFANARHAEQRRQAREHEQELAA
ncbi:MAG TPA: hypothetical protein VMA32_03825, partial [Streptosporangiaceae bacterium]|nr:hypothetical protein [Streptosporangiaceae bacterium]